MNRNSHIIKALAVAIIMASVSVFATVSQSSALGVSNEPSFEGAEYVPNGDGTATVTKHEGKESPLEILKRTGDVYVPYGIMKVYNLDTGELVCSTEPKKDNSLAKLIAIDGGLTFVLIVGALCLVALFP